MLVCRCQKFYRATTYLTKISILFHSRACSSAARVRAARGTRRRVCEPATEPARSECPRGERAEISSGCFIAFCCLVLPMCMRAFARPAACALEQTLRNLKANAPLARVQSNLVNARQCKRAGAHEQSKRFPDAAAALDCVTCRAQAREEASCCAADCYEWAARSLLKVDDCARGARASASERRSTSCALFEFTSLSRGAGL